MIALERNTYKIEPIINRTGEIKYFKIDIDDSTVFTITKRNTKGYTVESNKRNIRTVIRDSFLLALVYTAEEYIYVERLKDLKECDIYFYLEKILAAVITPVLHNDGYVYNKIEHFSDLREIIKEYDDDDGYSIGEYVKKHIF